MAVPTRIGWLVFCAALVARTTFAQPARVFVDGSPKAVAVEVVNLLRGLPDVIPVGRNQSPEVNLTIQKKGGAKAKCDDARAFFAGTSAAEIVAALRQWVQPVVNARRVSRARRAQAWAYGLQAMAQGLNAAAQGRSATVPSAPSALDGSSGMKLMLFGGPGHKTYLGCVSCGQFDVDSVFNQFGDHGNKFASNSVLNQFSDFGSKFGTYSACNQFASDPPVIVDRQGQYYGRLTVNTVNAERTRDTHLQAWISGVCAR
jgi:hypothetical protein